MSMEIAEIQPLLAGLGMVQQEYLCLAMPPYQFR